MRSSRSLDPYLPVEILDIDGNPTLFSSGALIMAVLLLTLLLLPVVLRDISVSLLRKFWIFNGD